MGNTINNIRFGIAAFTSAAKAQTKAVYDKTAALAQSVIPSQETLKQKVMNLDTSIDPKSNGREKLVEKVAVALQTKAASIAPAFMQPLTASAATKALTYHERTQLLLEDTQSIDKDPVSYFKKVEKEFVNNVTHYSLMQFIYEVVCKQTPKSGDVYSDIIRNNQEDSPIKYRFFSLIDQSNTSLLKRWAAKVLYQVGHLMLNYSFKRASEFFFSRTSPLIQDQMIKFLGKEKYLELMSKKNAMAFESFQHVEVDKKDIKAPLDQLVVYSPSFSLTKKVRNAFNILVKKAKLSISNKYLARVTSATLRIFSYAAMGATFIVDSIRQYFVKRFIKKWTFLFIQYACDKVTHLLTTPNLFSYNGYKIMNQIMEDLIKQARKGEMLSIENDFLMHHKELHELVKNLVDDKLLSPEPKKELSWYEKIKGYLTNTAKTNASTQAAHLAANLIPPFCNLFMQELYIEKHGAQFMDLVNISFQENAPEITDAEFNQARAQFESNTATFITLVLANTVTRQNDFTKLVEIITPDFVKMASHYASKKTVEVIHQKIKTVAMGMLTPEYIYKSIFDEEVVTKTQK